MHKTLFFLISLSLSLSGGILVSPSVVLAEESGQLKTVILDVDNMTCRLCPITVRKALRKVDGVVEVTAKYEGRGLGWAQVTFDPAKTEITALTRATAMAGFPSRVRSDPSP
ncbi:MAG: hypothetical protein GC138_10175 [Gammaproteobacteria bacterium]|nr:hypothetical protein [Gammaproteobacteria bacterium]